MGRKAMWTLRGWKETDEEGNEHMVAEEIPVPKEKQPSKESDSNSDEDQENNQNDKNVAEDENTDVIMEEKEDNETIEEKLKGPTSVREVYQRGCGIHCPDKALIRMKYVEF